ncbi:hypothetical protein KSP40_PGU018043 [Platanthera guangdongensis]|uniref:F-box/LRR-repeat protein n=1 Tax=Platanthera guangdongensis TaxID=2320717 RepID=A0ABR2MNL7_9ASPA
MQKNTASWSCMEMDCLVEIFMKLNLDDLSLAVPFVCKSWFVAASHPLCWRKLDFRRLDLLPWSAFSKSFALRHSLHYFSFTYFLKLAVGRSFKSVTELKFPLKFASMDDLVFSSNECPKLKSVALPTLSTDDEVMISELVCNWKDLERLEMESRPLNFPELVKKMSIYCKKISEIAVSGEVREEDAAAIASYLPKLKKLDLSDSYLTKKDLFVIVRGCRELDELNVNGCFGFEEDDKEIKSKVSGIRNFKSQGCKLYCEDAYEFCDWWDEYPQLNGYVF